MAQRPIWRGHLRLALVSCPVALYSARHERETIRFNMINRATGNRIKVVSQDAQTGEPLSRGDTVKGYEFSKGQYVIITDEDLESVKVESSGLMKVEKFVDASSIDPIYYDASYYLAPDGKGSEDVYAVVREAIARTGKVALTRVVISQRERTIALRPMDGGLVAHTLNEQRDLNPAQELFERVQGVTLDPEMITLATQLVERQSEDYDPADLEDRYESRLRAMLDAKIKGEALRAEAEPAYTDTNVVDLMAALRKSLGAPPTAEGAPGKSATGKRAAAAADRARTQPGLKLPLQGGKGATETKVPPQSEAPSARGRRKAS
jgi:DNA end-binding protein Ku